MQCGDSNDVIRQLEYLLLLRQSIMVCDSLLPLMDQLSQRIAQQKEPLLPEIGDRMLSISGTMAKEHVRILFLKDEFEKEFQEQMAESALPPMVRLHAEGVLTVLKRGDTKDPEEALRIWKKEPHY